MNIASKWDLPVLFVCENNLYAQSTSQAQTLAGDICARASAFGIRTATSDTWNWQGLFADMEQSVAAIRADGKPLFHRIDTFRLMAHSKGDDNRPDEEVRPWRERDPLNRLEAEFGASEIWQAWTAEIEAGIDAAVAQAEGALWADVTAAIADRTPARSTSASWQSLQFEQEKGVASVRKGLAGGLSGHDNVLLIGEDIESPYGGAFKATQGLSTSFPGRLRNTPISEAAIVGVGSGLAVRGMIPVVEIMFGDFLTLAADQWINHAAKFRFIYDDKVRVPLVVRTPMGGRRGYAATHSQSLEKHFIGLPDTQVLALHHRYAPALLYRTLFDTIDRPTLVIENKTLYGQTVSPVPPPGFELLFTKEPFPTAWLKPGIGSDGADVTVVAIGGASIDAEQAVLRLFEEEEIVADLFLPTALYPFDFSAIADSVRQTRHLLVVEEGQGFASLSSEILAHMAEANGRLRLRCARVTAAPIPIPAARPLEEECLPGVETIAAGIRNLVGASADRLPLRLAASR
jgi:2-oxoisovalerate dehydrogenase E1 component